ncbi:MAG TPA: N-acetyltransferase [Rubrobacter sp.]|nr:N-acetyltransferase [Rubrobacter sp.]
MKIRREAEGDIPAIREVNRRAFNGEDEARIVDDLRSGGYARLSLVAEEGGRIVGHIMFSEAVIRTERGEVAALVLGPVAVIPERQGHGIGSALVREGLDQCGKALYRSVFLLGIPDYYPRFGFSADLAGNLSSAYSGEAFMALELVPGALAGVTGEFELAPPFEAAS